jgi:predicted signal transduction protein with EAL and GGDEF domain
MGCDEAQGYLLGRPMPADSLAERLWAPNLVNAVDSGQSRLVRQRHAGALQGRAAGGHF